jgi:hypothetical protein
MHPLGELAFVSARHRHAIFAQEKRGLWAESRSAWYA